MRPAWAQPTAQAKIHLVNEFKEQPVEPTPDAPKPSEPVVEKNQGETVLG